MSNPRILRASILIGLAILLGRMLGFVRELLLARSFGKSGIADWAVMLFSFPDLIVNLLLGGALAAVLMPEWARQSHMERRRLYTKALAIICFLFILIAACLWVERLDVFYLLAPGLDKTLEAQGSQAFLLILLAIPLTALAGVTTAYSNFLGAVFVPAMGTFVLNFFVIVGIFLSIHAEEPLVVFGASVCLGAVIRWGLQLLNLRQTSKPEMGEVTGTSRSPGMKSLTAKYLQVLASASLLLLVPVIARAYASSLGSGQMALMNYAQKIIEFPIGIVATIVSSLLLPRLSRMLADEANSARAAEVFNSSIRFTFEISIVVLLPGLFYADAICNLLFKGSALQGEDLKILASLLVIGLIALPLQSLITIFVCAYNAMRDTTTPLIASAIAIALFVPGIRYVTGAYGLVGIAFSVVLFQLFVLVVLAVRVNASMDLNYLKIMSDMPFLRGVGLSIGIFGVFYLMGAIIHQADWFRAGWAVFTGAAMLLSIMLFNPNNKALISLKRRQT